MAVLNIIASPPADWSAERKQNYFEWAAKVVAGVRGVHPQLEAVFDGLHAHGVEVFQVKPTQGV